MTTIDTNGNHHAGAGAPGAGRFTAKGNQKPTGALEATAQQTVSMPTDEQFADFGRRMAALVGTRQWDGDLFQDLDEQAQETLGAHLGDPDPEVRAMWRGIADDNGITYDIDDDEYQQCSRCEDDVLTLSTDGLCDGCVEELATTSVCPNCGERVPNSEMNYEGTPNEMCDGCVHNAARSGWNPPG